MSIDKKALRAMSPEKLQSELARRERVIVRMMGSHYPNIVGGEIGQLRDELKRRRPRKVLYVTSAIRDEATYRFDVEDARGFRQRVYPCGKYQPHTMPESDQLETFCDKLDITHVASTFGETSTSPECIKDGVYTIKQYLGWWRELEKD